MGASRVVGLDVARAVALAGMVVVHFSLVGAADRLGPDWLAWLVDALDGRAAALFVILAGVGVTLMGRRAVASGDSRAVAGARRTLARRGAFLLVLGFVNLVIWPGDILRVYGVSLVLAALLLGAPPRRLLATAAVIVMLFVVMFLILDFESRWDWATLAYRGLWTPAGLTRNLFFDGFRAVLPWAGLLVFGMWLGRLDLSDRRVNGRVLAASLGVAIAAEAASRMAVSAAVSSGADPATADALLGTHSMPALPLFLLAAGGAATAAIAACVRLTAAYPGVGWRPLAATGRTALTWYAAHIVIGLGALEELGLEGALTPPAAVGWGLAFVAAAVLASWAYGGDRRLGPLEWLMRKLCG